MPCTRAGLEEDVERLDGLFWSIEREPGVPTARVAVEVATCLSFYVWALNSCSGSPVLE